MKSKFIEIDLRRLDLNLLLVFSALMQTGSVAGASERLFIGPSAVSMALGRLRSAIGDPLFVRVKTGMEPTPRAERLWESVAPALDTLHAAALEEKPFVPAEAQQTIRFGVVDDLEFLLVPKLLARLQSEAPGIQLSVRQSDFARAPAMLDEGEVDVALSPLDADGPAEERHCHRMLYIEHFQVVFNGALTGIKAPLSLDDFLSAPHLLISPRGDLRGRMDEELKTIGRKRHVLAAVTHFPTLAHMLRDVGCIASVPGTVASHLADQNGLSLSPVPFGEVEYHLGMIWHRRLNAEPSQMWFRNMVSEEVGKLRGDRIR